MIALMSTPKTKQQGKSREISTLLQHINRLGPQRGRWQPWAPFGPPCPPLAGPDGEINGQWQLWSYPLPVWRTHFVRYEQQPCPRRRGAGYSRTSRRCRVRTAAHTTHTHAYTRTRTHTHTQRARAMEANEHEKRQPKSRTKKKGNKSCEIMGI